MDVVPVVDGRLLEGHTTAANERPVKGRDDVRDNNFHLKLGNFDT
jgi:hypothetical protein